MLIPVACSTACVGGEGINGRSRLTIAIARDVGPINVYVGATDAMVGLVYDKLVEPSPHVVEQRLGLAAAITQVDSITWLVTVREGVKWHDGLPLTAADVAFTYTYFRDGPPTRYAHHVSAVPRIDSIQVVGTRQVRFVCGYPCPTLERITFADIPILPRHIWEQVAEPRKLSSLPVGTGPYRLVEYRPDQLYRFEANRDYFGGRPRIDELDMPVIPDQSSMFVALKTGKVDAVGKKVPPELLATFEKLPGVRVVRTTGLATTELRSNYFKPPFDRASMRRALSLAIDRDAIVRTVLLGLGRPGNKGYSHPDSPWSDPSVSTPYDSAAAVRLLEANGFADRDGDGLREWPDARPFELSVLVASGEPTLERTAELLTRQLLRFGIRTRLEMLEQGAASKRVSTHDFDLYLSEGGAHSSSDPDQFIVSNQVGYLWSDKLPYPELDNLILRWMSSSTLETRKQATYALQQFYNQQPTSIAVYYPDEYFAYRPAAYDGWVESRGYGIVHKWSFLPKVR